MFLQGCDKKKDVRYTSTIMKSGFAVLVGRSNVGKSTLMNALVGTKVAIMSEKPQTTRFPIHGVVHDPRGQLVLVDTPGIFERTHNVLTKMLNERAREALRDIDLIIYVADPTRAIGNEEKIVLRMIEPIKKPKILVINKSDVRRPPYLPEYEALNDKFDTTILVSALKGHNIQAIIDAAMERLPEGEPVYPEFQYTNMETSSWIAELIREKLFIQLGAELPYSIAVELEAMEEKKDKTGQDLLVIKANILTAQSRHKQIIIGKGGHKIKEVGSVARKELEAVLGRHVYLELEVVVDEHWPERLL